MIEAGALQPGRIDPKAIAPAVTLDHRRKVYAASLARHASGRSLGGCGAREQEKGARALHQEGSHAPEP